MFIRGKTLDKSLDPDTLNHLPGGWCSRSPAEIDPSEAFDELLETDGGTEKTRDAIPTRLSTRYEKSDAERQPQRRTQHCLRSQFAITLLPASVGRPAFSLLDPLARRFSCWGSFWSGTQVWQRGLSVEQATVGLRWFESNPLHQRGIAQPGRAPALGAGDRRFESGCPDQS